MLPSETKGDVTLLSSLLRNSQATALGIIIMGSNSHYLSLSLSLCPTVNNNKVVPVIAAFLKLFPRVICVRNITIVIIK